MIIGRFRRDGDRYTGVISTPGAAFKATFLPHTGAINYRIVTDDDCELGIAWNKTSAKGQPFISVKLDGPFVPKPVNCALFARDDGCILVWDRPDSQQQTDR